MLRPLGNNVVLREQKVEAKSSVGIILTGANGTVGSRGEVLEIGPEVVDVSVGNTVVVDWSKARAVKTEFGDFIIVAATDILAIVEND